MMRRLAAIVLAVITAACDRTPERGVDTTLPEELVPPAIISGSLSYPSDYIPEDMQICAEPVGGGGLICNAEKTSDTYTLSVPGGSYKVFARTAQLPKVKAYYSEFVSCGYEQWCTSHTPIVVTLDSGETRTGVDPGDWLGSSSPRPEAEGESSNAPSPDADTGTSDADEDSAYEAEPETGADLSSPPRGNMAGFVTDDDYPQDAIRNEQEGRVSFSLDVGPDGRVQNCVVTSSSGSSSLDSTTCRLAKSRMRLTPAKDSAGQPTTGTVRGGVNWALPE